LFAFRFSGDIALLASDRIELVKENDKHTIIVKKVLKAEEGTISVKATNDGGQMGASARLKVTGIIIITHEMQSIVTDVRGVCPSVSLSVCQSVSHAAEFGGACSVFGVIRCSLCQITLAFC